MPALNFVFPVADAEAVRGFAKEVQGERAGDFKTLQDRGTTTRETWFLQPMPDGTHLISVWFECDDPEKAFTTLADGSREAEWFRGRVKEVAGVDPAEPGFAESELLLEWRG